MLALPAGSTGDIVDRRKLILFTQAWMVAIASLLAALTFAGAMTPWLLLVFASLVQREILGALVVIAAMRGNAFT